MDKELLLLDIIDKNRNITQRELSKKANLSLGSINILLNKMIKNGFIKLRHIPMNRVIYMLTPKGMAEKATKTKAYIKQNYAYIENVKEKLIETLNDIIKEKGSVYLVIENDELGQLLRLAMNKVDGCSELSTEVVKKDKPIVVADNKLCDKLRMSGCEVINILERM